MESPVPERPWIKFFTSDWLGDIKLRRCSKAAKGVLIDLICMMNDSEEIGVLVADGKPISDEQICEDLGGDQSECKNCLNELESCFVIGRDERGCLCSLRMVRDADLYHKRASAGRKGGLSTFCSSKCSSKKGKQVLEHALASGFCASGICDSEKEGESEGEKKRAEPISDETVRAVWKAHPKPRGLKQAAPYIRDAIRAIGQPRLLECVLRYAKEQVGQDDHYTAHAWRWFRDERWNDEPSDENRGGQGSAGVQGGPGSAQSAKERRRQERDRCHREPEAPLPILRFGPKSGSEDGSKTLPGA